MSIPDNWQPPPCKHGAPPIIKQQWMDMDLGGTYVEKIPTHKTLDYDCPTPMECSRAAREAAA